MGESHYTPDQFEYIESVQGHAHQSALDIIGRLEREIGALGRKYHQIENENALLRGALDGVVGGDLLVQRRIPDGNMPFFWQCHKDSWLSGGPCTSVVEAAIEAERARRGT